MEDLGGSLAAGSSAGDLLFAGTIGTIDGIAHLCSLQHMHGVAKARHCG